MIATAILALVTSVTLNEKTGGFEAFGHAFENRYFMMEKGKRDVTALERKDVVVKQIREKDFTTFRCTNPEMPGVTIVKRYAVDAKRGSVRRTLAFRNTAKETKYVTPYVDCTFAPGFKTNLWHLGAGYIGPYKPYPDVRAPFVVNDYKQSSKGLVLIHPKNGAANAGCGNLSHYRVRIDDQVVWPWWHSSIGRYREYHDRLSYLPNGYRMGLGTFGLYTDKVISVTDQFNAFDGDLFTFFDDIFAADPDVSAELKTIPSAPKWFDNVFCCGMGGNDDYMLPWLAKMLDEGEFMPRNWGSFSWGEYVDRIGLRGTQGGFITTDEFAAFMKVQRDYAPGRIHPSHYGIVIAASWFTRVLKEHPAWFRVHDRNGATDSLFPGVSDNFQTMFNNPDCRAWMVEMLVAFAKRLGNDVVYVDESQQTNTIDWDRDQVTLDSDSVKFWKLLKMRFHEEGIVFWANGSGNPYADLNYMESPDELSPSRWRDWAGVGFGISMMNRMKRGNRTALLVWKNGNDYANRVVALGWVPHPYEYNAVNLPVMRAVWQEGNLFPVNATYAPDWKTDAAVQVESHAMKRADAPDVILSFISRAVGTNDIPVSVDLGSLGFARNERINVWKLNYSEYRNSGDLRRILSDREIKANWRERGILGGARVSDPILVYSGPASGTFRDTIAALRQDKMEQYVVTASPLAFFAVDGQPIHAFFTAQRHGTIRSRTVTLAREADLILADRETDFAEVTANGAAVPTRKIRLADGFVATLVRLEKGTWTLAWRTVPRAGAAAGGDLPVVPKTPPLTAVAKPKAYLEPEHLVVTNVGRTLAGGVRLLRKGVYSSSNPLAMRLQENLPLVCTAADEERLSLTAGPSRRQFYVRSLATYAGFELEGARQVHLRLSHNYNESTQGVMRNPYKTGDNAAPLTDYFGGIVVDYSVGGKYTKRVSMAAAFYHPDCRHKFSKWGKVGCNADERLNLGAWIEEPSPKVFSLDLVRFAPKDWDGRVWLSLGTCHFLAGHHLGLDILSFNDAAAKDFVIPVVTKNVRMMPPPLKSTPLCKKPHSLAALDAEEWKGWTKTSGFWSLASGRPKAQTTAYVAHDDEYLYVGLVAEEPLVPVLSGKEAWSNDHVEFLVDRPDGKVYQVIAAPKSETVFLLNRHRDEPRGIVVRDSVAPGRDWKVFLAIPLDDLKPNMQLTPVTLKMELARIRKAGEERSAWTPLETGFFERKNYGTVILDFSAFADGAPVWAKVTQTAKPWAYNWWMGSAVDAAGLEAQCAAMEEAGLGGFHVIPIYGAEGYESRERPMLSSEWVEAWNLAVRTARRHGLGVDLTMGSGWCFGGPWVTKADAASSGMRVKRAGPGGEGYMIDPFSPAAMSNHIARFEAAFGRNGTAERPRAFYHDSYEYYEARPKHGGDWDEQLLRTFGVWTDWCRANGYLTRNEAHGSPVNWLDFYAIADVPETEMFGETCRDVLISKFASSAAHVTGKRLVSSESCTWIGQHFGVPLAEYKRFIDRLFLSGVNHLFYHGCCYSPVEASWPGWCFYASSEMNPRNPVWRDAKYLNAYIARCQAMFQTSEPDNDTLLYWPLSDYRRDRGGPVQMTVHDTDWFYGQLIGETALKLSAEGCAFDYVSDRQLQTLDLRRYAKLVVPPHRTIPPATRTAIDKFISHPVRLEPFAAAGLAFTRQRRGDETVYFLVNTNNERIVTTVRPSAEGQMWWMDPMTGAVRPHDGTICLEPSASGFLVVRKGQPSAPAAPPPAARHLLAEACGPWTLTPVCGGPTLPPKRTMATLSTWSRRADGGEEPFSGTMRYETAFNLPCVPSGEVVIDLGRVEQSALVRLNGREVGFSILAPYRVMVPAGAFRAGRNTLEVDVTSVGQNRLRQLGKEGVRWAYFKNINMIDYRLLGTKAAGEMGFRTETLPFQEYGLFGPVRLFASRGL